MTQHPNDELRWGPAPDAVPATGTPSEPEAPDARVDQLAADIEDTRDDLTRTISEIGDRLDPATIARDARETVRVAALGKVDQMTYGAQETWRDVRTGNTGSIVDTITRNPIPAGMVALGIGMLFMSRGQQAQRGGWSGRDGGYGTRFSSGFGGGTRYEAYGAGRGASWEKEPWRRATGDSPFDRVGDVVAGAGDRVGQAADEAGRRVGDAVDTVGQAVDSVGQAAGQLPEQAGWVLEQGGGTVRRFIDDNPLAAGAIALAAGAAIGLLLPTTPFERDTLGEARDTVVDRAEAAAHEALDKVDEAASTRA